MWTDGEKEAAQKSHETRHVEHADVFDLAFLDQEDA